MEKEATDLRNALELPAERMRNAPVKSNAERNAPSPSPSPKPIALVLPDWLDKDLWDGFLEVRKKKRAPNTERALKLNLEKLVSFKSNGQDPNEVLKQSVEKGYQGLFEVKGTTSAFTTKAPSGVSIPAYKRGS